MQTSHQRHGLTRRLPFGLVLLCLLFPAAAFGTGPVASEQPAVSFGCDGTVGALVISNVNCTMGVASAFDLDLSTGLAPWCDGQVNLQVYGCSIEQASSQPAGCLLDVPSLHGDGVQRATDHRCEGDEWVDEVLVRLEVARVQGQRCLAKANPGPACLP